MLHFLILHSVFPLHPGALDTVCDNDIYWGGLDPDYTLLVSDSVFENCAGAVDGDRSDPQYGAVSSRGGALCLRPNLERGPNDITVVRCTFLNCSASHYGGAIYTLAENVTVTLCEAIGCRAATGSFWCHDQLDRAQWVVVADENTAYACTCSAQGTLTWRVGEGTTEGPFAEPADPAVMRIFNCSFCRGTGDAVCGLQFWDPPSPTVEFTVLLSCSGGPGLFARHSVTPRFDCLSFFNCSKTDRVDPVSYPEQGWGGLFMMRNGTYAIERALFVRNNYPLFVSSTQPKTLTIEFVGCIFDEATFPPTYTPGINFGLTNYQIAKDDGDWMAWKPCSMPVPSMAFSPPVADYSASRRLVAIGMFIVLLADGLPLSVRP